MAENSPLNISVFLNGIMVLLTFFGWRSTAKSINLNNYNTLVQGMISNLDVLRSESSTYWVKEGVNDEERKVVSLELTYRIKRIRTAITALSNNKKYKKIFGGFISIEESIDSIHNLDKKITNGDFQSLPSPFVADNKRAEEITKLVSDFREYLERKVKN